MRHRTPRALVLIVIAPPQLGDRVVAAVGAVAVGGSAVHDRRGAGTHVDNKRIYVAAYDSLNKRVPRDEERA